MVKSFLKRNSNLVKKPVVLQPLEVPEEPYEATCRRIAKIILEDTEALKEHDFRVIPQVHKLLGLK